MAKSKVSNKKRNRGGRPTRYKPEYADLAYKFCLLGATNEQLGDFFGVPVSTIHNWRKRHKQFLDAIKKGKSIADANVADSLYHRAKGYSHPEDKIFNNNGEALVVPTTKHYPPDTVACIYWLNNRQPDRFRNVKAVELTGKDGGPVAVSGFDIRIVEDVTDGEEDSA
jgi:hypothetical protein